MSRRVRVKGVASLLEQSARLIHGAGHSHGLYPAQWTALRYFAEAMPQARTATGLMRFQNMAMSPVARTVRALVEKGLVSRQPNPRDGRSDLIELTSEGHALLRFDPRNDLESLLGQLPPDQLASLALALQTVIQGMVETDASSNPSEEVGEDQ
ncbi:MarR family winged helix-turn-helix transcriptional regulator [Roseomonas genomospecies 6]|uniref:MarR family transcriptional regulator n=1 Tax=Roseomonas genomospecies 6 TaxID=214106 RepID=A0A9W7NL22_9PROT|nr:MarR family transcriptional regulator [Roseomonas genomospecies 6]KAA0681895.1 MarR family transcriptional regulator [Roseomonas genomospecies 6]